MKMKEAQLSARYNALSKVANYSMPGTLAIDIMRNIKALSGEFDSYCKVTNQLLDKYALKDSDGKFVMRDETHVELKPDTAEEYQKEIFEINEKEIEIDKVTIVDISAFEKCGSITATDLMSLDFMIKDE